jgi:biliverdin reductase/flavin reductase
MKPINKVVIFGATGNTGIETVEVAINSGFYVTAFVRNKSKLPSNLNPHQVIVGDVLNLNDAKKAVRGQDGVIICLGTRDDFRPTTMLSEGTKNILKAMKEENVKRVCCCVSSFLFLDPSDPLWKPIYHSEWIDVTKDHKRMFNALKDSDREWIAVFPPRIEDYPARGNYILSNDAPVEGRVISKQDLARVLVHCLTDTTRIGHAVGVGYKDDPNDQLINQTKSSVTDGQNCSLQ